MAELQGAWGHYDKHPKYVLCEGDDPVSRVVVIERRIGLGHHDGVVRCAGLGEVWTDPEHRRRGLARRCLTEALADLQAEGRWPLSLLFGIPDFYHKFGFATIATASTFTVPTAALPPDGPPGRPLTEADWPAVRALYRQVTADQVGAVVRPPDWRGPFGGPGWSRGATCRVLDGPAGPVAYLVYDAHPEKGFGVSEAVAAGPREAAALAALTRRLAGDEPEIVFHLAAADPFAIHLRRYGGLWEERVSRSGFLMARILDLRPFVEALLPALNARLAASSSRWYGTLELHADGAPLALALDGDAIALAPPDPAPRSAGERWTIRLPRPLLAQLAFGYRPVWDVAAEPGVAIPEPLQELLDLLFPRQQVWIGQTDRF